MKFAPGVALAIVTKEGGSRISYCPDTSCTGTCPQHKMPGCRFAPVACLRNTNF